MENNTSLVPDSLKAVAKDYKYSFLFIFKNKWLYLIPLFFVVCGVITQNSMHLYQKILYPDLYKQPFLLNNFYQTTQQSFSEKLIAAISSVHLFNILSSISFLGIFNLLGVAIAFFAFYKNIKNLHRLPFMKKVELYSFFVFLSGLIVSLASYFFFKNIVIISLGVLVGLTGLQILFVVLFTLIEIILISYLKSLLLEETPPLDLLSSQSEKFLKPLFFFNIIITFISPTFLVSVALLPDILNSLIFGQLGNFSSSIPQAIYTGIFSIVKYFNALFTLIFIFTPFILALNSSEKLLPAIHENLSIIKRKLGYYLWLIFSAILFLAILSVVMELVNPSSLAYTQNSTKEILYSIVYSLISTFFLIVFFTTVFRSIIKNSRKTNLTETKPNL
ncbi:MAG: hypothetical protein Q7K55_03290 [Candidatus Levybacteria bacterium]|nr:hypothetical protein [Candidatus Levybacteria bacterium]